MASSIVDTMKAHGNERTTSGEKLPKTMILPLSAKAESEWSDGSQGKVHPLDDWPPKNADQSQIENVWSRIQAHFDSAGFKKLDEFKAIMLSE